MSHFAVLVVTKDKPTEEILAAELQPFHEFECTGVVDQYVQSIDKLQEARERYAGQKEPRFKSPGGELLYPYEDQFYRDPTPEEVEKIGFPAGMGSGHGLSWFSKDWGDGKGYRAKVHFLPEGYEELEVPPRDLFTFTEFVQDQYGYSLVKGDAAPDVHGEHKHGWIRVDAAGEVAEVVDRTNPNAKWDWWVVGGRHTGFFRIKPGVSDSGVDVPELGRPGLMTPPGEPGTADVARKNQIDFAAMRAEAEHEAGEAWDKVRRVVDGKLDGFAPWPEVLKKFGDDLDGARKFYGGQPAMMAIAEARKAGDHSLIWIELEDFLVPREEYTRKAGDCSCVAFAFLHDGHWAERGKMGWWATVTNERGDWIDVFQKLLADVPDDHWLTIVDCHI